MSYRGGPFLFFPGNYAKPLLRDGGSPTLRLGVQEVERCDGA